jgi:hypothetical protein
MSLCGGGGTSTWIWHSTAISSALGYMDNIKMVTFLPYRYIDYSSLIS